MAKYNVGDTVIFRGYADPDMPAEDRLFNPGDRLVVQAVQDDGTFACVPEDGGAEGQALFEQEIEGKVDAEIAGADPMAFGVRSTDKPLKAAPSPAKMATSGSQMVAEILAGEDALDAAKRLLEQAEKTYYALGGVLAYIYRNDTHKSLGYEGKRSFELYVESELGMKYRKAMYLIDIYEKFTDLNLPEERISQIGWSKAKELTRVIDEDNADELLGIASSATREELVERVKEIKEAQEEAPKRDGRADVARRRTMKFRLFEDQANVVRAAIDAAKGQAKIESDDQALEYIATEWAMLSGNVEVPLDEVVKAIETRFGVTVKIEGEPRESKPAVKKVVETSDVDPFAFEGGE